MSVWARLSSAIRRRPFTSALAALLFLVVLILAAVSLLLYSEPGRNALARYLEDVLSTPGEFELSIGRLQGTLPFQGTIDRITVADRDGIWLAVHDIEFEWSPLKLMGARLQVDAVRVRELKILRRPAAGGQTPSPQNGRLAVSLPPLQVDLESLRITDLRLEEPVLGQSANLTVAAGATALYDQARARVTVERTDGLPGQARAIFEWDESSGSLDIEGFLSEPENGLLASLLDLPGRPPLDISLNGDGSAGDWRGHLEMGAGSLLGLVSELSVSAGPEFRLAVQGDAVPGDSLEPALSALLGPHTAFDVELLHRADEPHWSIAVKELASGAINLQGKAQLDVGTSHIGGEVQVKNVNGKRLTPFLGPSEFRSATARFSFDGPLLHPVVNLETVVEDLSAQGFAAAGTNISAELRPDRPLNDPNVRIAMDASASFNRLETPSPELDALLGGSPRIDVAGALLEGFNQLNTGRLTVTGNSTTASLEGNLGLDDGLFRASGQATVGDLAPLSARAGRTLAGQVRTDFALSRGEDGEIELTLDGALREVGLEQPVVERLLGPNAAFGGKLRRHPDGSLSVSDMRLTGKGMVLGGQMSLPPALDRLDAGYDISVGDLDALGIADPLRGDGRLDISGKAAGKLSSPVLTGDLQLANAVAGGFRVEQLKAEYSVSDLATAPRGKILLEGETDFLPDFSGRTGFELRERILELSALEFSARGAVIEGGLAVPLDGGAAKGSLTFRAADISAWSDLAGRNLTGGMDGRIGLSGEDNRQDVRLDITASAVGIGEQIKGRHIILKTRITDLAANPRLKGKIMAGGLQAGQAQFSEISLGLDGGLGDIEYRLHAAGQIRDRDIGIDAAGRFRKADNRTTLSISSLSGTAADIPVRLLKEAVVELQPAIDIGDFRLAVGDGTMGGRFRQDEERVSLRAEGSALPLDALWPDAPPQLHGSRIDLSASLDGPAANPAGRMDLVVAGLAAGEAGEREQGLTLAAKAELGGGQFVASGDIQGLPDVTASIEASLPARLSLAPAAFTVDEDTPLTGRFVYRGPVGSGWALMGQDRHKLDGQADVAVDISGTLGKPHVSGRAELANGRYENFDTGTILTEMQVSARPSDSAITIDKATASDGNGGTVSLSGRIDFGGGDLLDLDLAADLDKARLVRRDELTAVASGHLTLRGGAARRTVAGRVEIDEAEVRLVGGRPAGVVEIPVEETGTPPPGVQQAPPRTRPSRTDLDLSISMPKRIFVRGRGLDSEWSGELKVTGTASSPRVQGELRPLRGRYDFAGKIFTLRDGSIAFAGKDEIDPALDLSAERRATDITAIIHVTGTARKPEVTLESIPDYPQDEVLSRVLFNKSTGRLSAGEALQLAQAVGTLTGVSDGGGIMDFARGMLRLDVLRFSEQSDNSEGGAEAGKYLSDRIYLGVEGTAAGETGVTVEIEITPSLKLEGDIGPNNKNQTGLKWKRDY